MKFLSADTSQILGSVFISVYAFVTPSAGDETRIAESK